jgi:hypothetical protein
LTGNNNTDQQEEEEALAAEEFTRLRKAHEGLQEKLALAGKTR